MPTARKKAWSGDSIENSAIWSALKHQSISEQYVVWLKMYDGQSATVLTDIECEKLLISSCGIQSRETP